MFIQFNRLLKLAQYHHPSQFYWRLHRKTQRLLEKVRVGASLPDRSNLQLDTASAATLIRMAERRIAAFPHRSASLIHAQLSAGKLSFLNQPHVLRFANAQGVGVWNWSPPQVPRLWRFHLQCHEYLLPLAVAGHSSELSSLLGSWLSQPRHSHPLQDQDAWHPFCISRRVPIWLMLAALDVIEPHLQASFWKSLGNQVHWLCKHLEYDLGGNHLLENLRTLVMAKYAVDWRQTNQDRGVIDNIAEIALNEFERQVLAHGEHLERTPTYHALMTLAAIEMADLLASKQHEMAERASTLVNRMSTFLTNVAHPDGQIPLIGDSVFDETPLPSILEDSETRSAGNAAEVVAKDVVPNELEYGASICGPYWIWRSAAKDYLLFDTGVLACNHLPAHGHADLLNIEASIDGQRVFVDAGTFDYEVSEMRQYCRGTEGHNVVQVDQQSHADVWSRFRMGRRGKPILRRCGEFMDWSFAVAAHDAYQFIGVPFTGRLVMASAGPKWIVIDWVVMYSNHRMENRLKLHPDVVHVPIVSGSDKDGFAGRQFRAPGGTRSDYQLSFFGEGVWSLESGWYCPDFGQRLAADVFKFQGDSRSLESGRFAWSGWTYGPSADSICIRPELATKELTLEIDDHGKTSRFRVSLEPAPGPHGDDWK